LIIRPARELAVSSGHDRRVIEGPLKPERIPGDALILFWRVDGIGFVNHQGIVFEGKKAMRESGRSEKQLPSGGIEFAAKGLSETGRISSHIQKNVEHTAPQAIDQLGVGGRWDLEMHSAKRAFGGGRIEFLARRERNSKIMKQAFVKRFDEYTARVVENARLEQQQTGESRFDRLQSWRLIAGM